jgi:hypothetical protein
LTNATPCHLFSDFLACGLPKQAFRFAKAGFQGCQSTLSGFSKQAFRVAKAGFQGYPRRRGARPPPLEPLLNAKKRIGFSYELSLQKQFNKDTFKVVSSPILSGCVFGKLKKNSLQMKNKCPKTCLFNFIFIHLQ